MASRSETLGDTDLRLKIAAAFAAVYVIYGSTYLGLKVMVDNGVPPIAASGVRFALAGGGLLLVLRLRGARTTPDSRSTWRDALLGMLLLAPFGFVGLAERDISSGLASLLVAAVPLFIVVLQATVDRVHVPARVLAGVGAGLGGVALLAFSHGGRAEGTAVAIAVTLGAALAIAVGSFLVPRLALSGGAFVSAGWQLVWAGAILIAVGAISGEVARFDSGAVGSDGVLAFVLLLVFATVPPYASYIWLLGRVPVSQVATASYVNPLVAVLLGWIVVGEEVVPTTLVGGGMILAAVMLVVARAADEHR